MPIEGESLASLSLTSAAIIVLLWGAIWALRRLRGGAASPRDCAVLRALPLGPRERLLVVRVGARHLVVGVGSSSVSLLCELAEPLPSPTPGEAGFADAVRKAIGTWRGA